MFSPEELSAIALSLKLASVTTIILLVFGTPIAWWLASSASTFKSIVSAIIAVPLVLPPTVIGFYLLLLMSPQGVVGQFTQAIGLGTLPFTFAGLVVASVIYSMPFVIQPIQNAIDALGKRPLEVAATLRAGPVDQFFSVILPLARPGFISAAVLGFAHTMGEFGIVLMIGGNIPDETRVASVLLYDHVEALDYARAHMLAGALLVFSFTAMLSLYLWQRKQPRVF